MNPLRVGLVGLGRISDRHIKAIQAQPKLFELVAVCDTNEERLRSLATSLKAEPYRRFEVLVENAQLDLVSLCTPSGLHAQQTIAAAQKGLHVITEKPMATRWKDGVRMVEACDQNQVNLFVVKQNRLNSTLQALKRAISQNRFGKIFYVVANVFWSRPQTYYDSDSWRGTWEFDGGALMNQASHYVDLLDWLVGPVESVQAQTATLARHIEVEDTAAVILKWRSGPLGTINVSMLSFRQNLEGSLTILGENGTVRVGGIALNKILHWEFADETADDAVFKETGYSTDSVYGFGHELYYKNVGYSLRGDEAPVASGREGLRSLELLVASYLSARRSERVILPLEY